MPHGLLCRSLPPEMAAGPSSERAAYVATLPERCPDCLLNWSAAEKTDLAGTLTSSLQGLHARCAPALSPPCPSYLTV